MNYSKFTLFVFLVFALVSCDSQEDKKDKDQTSSQVQAAFLANLSDNIIVPAYAELNESVNSLSMAIDSFSASGSLADLNLAQTKLKEAYLNWQGVSSFEFGPAAQLALKSNVNVFPTDTNLIRSNINLAQANLDALSNKTSKGFPALDYLLNHSSDSSILQEFSIQNRKDYLLLVSRDLQSKINQVTSDWGGYQSTFKSGSGTDIGSSTGQLVNALNQQLERFFRDGKIGIPLGIRSAGIALPDNSEALYGAYSFDLIRANFSSMKSIYTGNSGVGLDNYLVEADAAGLNQLITTQLAIIESKINQFSGSMPAAIQSNAAELQATYNEIQKLIVYWKVDLPSRLGVLISYQDNDGD